MKEHPMSNSATNDNHHCQERAHAYLVELIGNRPHTVTWDTTHCLQGHVHLGYSELVLIAPRDAVHEPVVLTETDWDVVRRCPGQQRRDMIRWYAITDTSHLAACLAA
jgi:hypothetical protein